MLNLREGLPSGAEATRRAEGWLRSKQIERAGEVLIITGRGNGSLDGIPVVRTEVMRLLTRLRQQGVIAQVREHTPGSFAIVLAPLRQLFEAPSRRQHRQSSRRTDAAPQAPGFDALDPRVRAALRVLAQRAVESLGVRDPTESMVQAEMQRQFGLLTTLLAASGLSDDALAAAVEGALADYDDEL